MCLSSGGYHGHSRASLLVDVSTRAREGGRSLTVIAEGVFVDKTALALPGCISYPDTANPQVPALGFIIEFFPEGFI